MVKFAHLSDVHLGSWNNHPDLREYPLRAWSLAVDKCIAEGADFIIIAGDFFDTSLPPVDALRRAASEMRRLKEHGIAVYAIAGSHDFSPTGKSMLNVLEDGGLMKNVAKMEEENGKIKLLFTEDEKTKAKLCGIVGRRGSLERSYFDMLDRSIEQESGTKIFVFHAGIAEFSTGHPDIAALPLAALPKNFVYYASGHVHVPYYNERERIAFPGPLFPADFSELESYDSGFYVVEQDGASINVKRVSAKLCGVSIIKVSADGKSPSEIQSELESKIKKEELSGKILLIKVEGVLDGRASDINLRPALAMAAERGAAVIKKSVKVTSREYEETKIAEHSSVEELEGRIISEQSAKGKLSWLGAEGTEKLVLDLMNCLRQEKQEDESTSAYNERMKAQGSRILGVDNGENNRGKDEKAKVQREAGIEL